MSASARSTGVTLEYYQSNIATAVEDIEHRLKHVEFMVNPLSAVSPEGVPYGFYTIGFTSVLLPEIYVSGVYVNDDNFRVLYPFLKSLYSFLTLNGCALQPAGEVCKLINDQLVLADLHELFQARPVDAERMMYGQCLTLRHWAAHRELLDAVQGIQIVHKGEEDTGFPVVSTPTQLLLDYVPFGTPTPKPIMGVQNVGSFDSAASPV